MPIGILRPATRWKTSKSHSKPTSVGLGNLGVANIHDLCTIVLGESLSGPHHGPKLEVGKRLVNPRDRMDWGSPSNESITLGALKIPAFQYATISSTAASELDF